MVSVHPTGYPEKYSTVKFDDNFSIKEFLNKDINGFDYAFIGLAGFTDYQKFWSEEKKDEGELVNSFKNPEKYNDFQAEVLDWFDTGNLDIRKSKVIF